MVKERRSANGLNMIWFVFTSKNGDSCRWKAKSIFKRKPYALKIRIKNRSVGIWKPGRPVSLCKKIEMQYQICYTEQWYKSGICI